VCVCVRACGVYFAASAGVVYCPSRQATMCAGSASLYACRGEYVCVCVSVCARARSTLVLESQQHRKAHQVKACLMQVGPKTLIATNTLIGPKIQSQPRPCLHLLGLPLMCVKSRFPTTLPFLSLRFFVGG